MKRDECLAEAKKCICNDRDLQYGSPSESFSLIGKLWSAYLGVEIKPKDVGIMMALFKAARCRYSSKPDNFVDGSGYFACAVEVDTENQEK